MRRDAFAAAGEAEPLGGRRLDADPVGVDAGDARRARRASPAACGPIFGASQTSVQSRWLTAKPRAAARAHRLGAGRSPSRALPGRIGGREPLADVAFGERAEDRVGQRMHADVGVGMARRGRGRRAMATPQSVTASPGPKACTSKPLPVRMSMVSSGEGPRALEVGGGGDLEVGVVAGDEADREPAARATAASSRRGPRLGAVRGEDRAKRKPWGVCARQSPSRGTGASARPASARQSASTTGRAGKAAGAVSRAERTRRMTSGRQEGARGVMDQHPVGRCGGERLEPGEDRAGAAGASVDRRHRGGGRRSRRGLRRRARDPRGGRRPGRGRGRMGEQRIDRAAQRRLAAEGRYCFGVASAEALATSRRHDQPRRSHQNPVPRAADVLGSHKLLQCGGSPAAS